MPSERRNCATLACLFSNRGTVQNASPAATAPSAAAPAPPINPPAVKLMVTEVPRFATTPADPAAIQRRRRRRNWSP